MRYAIGLLFSLLIVAGSGSAIAQGGGRLTLGGDQYAAGQSAKADQFRRTLKEKYPRYQPG